MFWRFGNYAQISSLDTLLDKNDLTLEELLEETDLIQELKQQNNKLIEYLRDENILRRLLEYVVAPQAPKPQENADKSQESPRLEKKSMSPFRRREKEKSRYQEELEKWEKEDKDRQKHSYLASEILSSDTYSIAEAVMEHQDHLRVFWGFLSRDSPLDATEAGYFTKVNEALLDKKTEDTLNFIRSLDAIVPTMLNHVDCPMVMDLLLKIISMEKAEGGAGIVDWLESQNLIPLLLTFLSEEHSAATQTSAGDFLKAIITISANASQNEQSCIGPNNLTRQLVSEPCIEVLVKEMLRGGNPLTVGVGIIIEVIRKNNSDYDPDAAGSEIAPSSSDPIYLGTLLRHFAKHVPDFMGLILSPNHVINDGEKPKTVKRESLAVASGTKIEPLGFDRFKTCELMAELLHCSNMGLLNEQGSEAYIQKRDAERERLKAEGNLAPHRPPPSAATEFSEDGSAQLNGRLSRSLGESPEEIRRLEVINNADDDGFEDVGTSADLANDMEDDFEDDSTYGLKPKPGDVKHAPQQARPRLDLDEDFVDEPLTSPRLEALDEKEQELLDDLGAPDLVDQQRPGAGTLSTKLGNMTITDKMLPSYEESQSTDSSVAQQQNMPDKGAAPPLPQRKKSLDTTPKPLIQPHPDDKPAPLFSNRSDQHQHQEADRPGDAKTVSESQDTIDTTLAEEGDSSRSLLMSGQNPEQEFLPQIDEDIDGQPLVGDFLKMMFVEHHVVPTILDFFFRFPWNNFLHNVVYDVVQQVFNGSMDRGYNSHLAVDLFDTGRISDRVVEGQQRSDEAQARNNMRLGYMGHLTLIAEEVVKFSDRHPPELLSQSVLDKVTSKQWTDYVENTLSETRERDNAILGGVRPEVSMAPRQAVLNAVSAAGGTYGGGASSALANAGLNGSAGLDSMDLTSNNGSGTSALGGFSSSSLFSGFGSSSDEEDEEMEEGDGIESQGNTDNPKAPNTVASASSSIPTIPPPLNLPPSRARRQLAARLALHSREAQQQPPDPEAHSNMSGTPEEGSTSINSDKNDTSSSPLPDQSSQQQTTLDDPFEPSPTKSTQKDSLSPRSPTFRFGLDNSTPTEAPTSSDEDTDEDNLNTTIHLSPEPTQTIFRSPESTLDQENGTTDLSPSPSSSPTVSNTKDSHLLGFNRIGESGDGASGGGEALLEGFANSPAAEPGDEGEGGEEG